MRQLLKTLLFSFILSIAAISAYAQSPVIINAPYKFQKWVSVKDSLILQTVLPGALVNRLGIDSHGHIIRDTTTIFNPSAFKLKADSIVNSGYVTHGYFNANASYLGDWNSTFAIAGYYNKPGKIVSYNGVMYVIKTNPGTNPPTNTNGGTPYYEPYNPAGKRTIKIMSLASGVNAYSILSLYEPTTLQAYLKMNIVVGENVSGNYIEAQAIDANLSNIDHLTPFAWYTVNPKTFKSNLDTTLLKNRSVLVQVRYNPGVSGFGTLEVRYKSNYGIGRYVNGIFVKSSTLSNRDLFPLDSTYTVTGSFPVIEPSSTEYLNQIYDANGLKYLKEGGSPFLPKGGSGITIGADSAINLGGSLNSTADFDLNGNPFQVRTSDFHTLFQITPSIINTKSGNGNQYGILTISATGTSLNFVDDATDKSSGLLQDVSGVILANHFTNDGLKYDRKYSLPTLRNIPDKGAVDSIAIAKADSISSLRISDTTALARKSGSAAMQQASYKALAGGGNGYYDMISQSVSPAAVTGHLRVYSDSLNRLSWKNSTYRRTIRVTRNSDQTIQVPFKFNPILSDSTDVFTAIALKQPRIISALPTQTLTRPIVGDSVNKAFAKLIFRGDSIASAIGTRLLKTDTAAMLSPIAHRNTNNTFTGANTFSGTAAITAVFNRGTASSNSSIQLSNTSQSWFTGVASGSDFVVGVTSNLTAGGLFGVSVAGNVKIPTTPATASGTYDFLVRDQGNTTIQKIAGSVLPVVNGGTSFSTYTTGDLLYASATNTLSKLAGNTATSKLFLTSTGSAGVATAPAYYNLFGVTNAWTSPQNFNGGLQSTGIVDMQSTNFTTTVSSNARFTDLSTGQSLNLFPVTITATRAVRIQDKDGTLALISDVTSPIVGTPTISAGAGAGTTPTVSVTSNGKSLQVTVTTGTLPTGTNAVIATVTLANALSYTPYPVFSSANAATSLLNGASMVYMTSSGPTNVTITSGTTALVAATTYVWNINL